MFHIKNAPELLKEIKNIKSELELIKNDIVQVKSCAVNQDEKIIGFFSAFVTTHNTTMGAKKEYQSMYDAIQTGDSNILTTIDSLISKFTEEEKLLTELLNKSNDQLDDRTSMGIVKNFEEIAIDWEKIRNIIGKIDDISMDFVMGATKIDDIVELGKTLINDIDNVGNNIIKDDFKAFIVSAIKDDLNHDKEFFHSGNHNWRRNFYELVYPVLNETLKRCFANPIGAVAETDFIDFVKSGTYRIVPQLRDLANPAKNRTFIENSIYNLFYRKYTNLGFPGDNLDDFISWLHSSGGGGGGAPTLDALERLIRNYSNAVNNDFTKFLQDLANKSGLGSGGVPTTDIPKIIKEVDDYILKELEPSEKQIENMITQLTPQVQTNQDKTRLNNLERTFRDLEVAKEDAKSNFSKSLNNGTI